MAAPPRAERRSSFDPTAMRRAMFDTKRRFTQKILNSGKEEMVGLEDDEFKTQKKVEIAELKKMLVRLAGAIKGYGKSA